MATTRILAVDGGGVKGVIPAYLIHQLELKLRHVTKDPSRRLVDCFDILIGTSTGAIIASALAVSKSTGKGPKAILDLYEQRAGKVFNRGNWLGFQDWVHWLKKKAVAGYSPKGLEEELKGFFDNRTLGEIVDHRLLVVAFNGTEREHQVFDSADPDHAAFELKSVCRASSAAPTYFPAHCMTIANQPHVLIDGGVAANNPAALGLARAIDFLADPNDVVIVSIGTGENKSPITASKWTPEGDIPWIVNAEAINICFDGSSAVMDEIVKTILPPVNVFRFQPSIPDNLTALDDARNVPKLVTKVAATFWTENEARFYDALSSLTDAVAPTIGLAGTWESNFTWTETGEGGTEEKKSSKETIQIQQSGLSVRGQSVEGEFEYNFFGRIVKGTKSVVGQWHGVGSGLLGSFHLAINLNNDALDGFWMGTGQGQQYYGGWNLVRTGPAAASLEATKDRLVIRGGWQLVITDIVKNTETPRPPVMARITQSGDAIRGVSLGDAKLRFRGRVHDEFVIGEWEGIKAEQTGPFQLRKNQQEGCWAGYWIGTGASGLSTGKLTLTPPP